MDIEAIVTKYAPIWDTGPERERIRSALTELAAEYEQKIAGLESEAILSRALSERIRQLEAERVPKGWKLVPIEPTTEMIDAGRWSEYRDEGDITESYVDDGAVSSVWDSMLAAAQQPKKEGE